MTNPAQAIRMLITYAICIPLAMLMGYVMTEVGNRPDFSNLFVVGLVVAVLASPILIRWHYPIMVFGLGCPMYLFFLKGNPPLMQVVVILSLGIAIVERAVNSERRFIKCPTMVWPLLFTAAMAFMTAQLTGGIGLKALGGDTGGGKKYVALFIGVATFFALISRKIPKDQRNLYIAFFLLSGSPAFISDLFPVLPAPLNYINLFFPPSGAAASGDAEFSVGATRMSSLASSFGTIAVFLLAKYGLKGVFSLQHPLRCLLFISTFILNMLGGFRIVLITYIMLITMLFFLEGLHRTRMLLVFAMIGILGGTLLVPFAHKLPFTFQRALSFLPLDLDPVAKMDADGSKEWRERMWADVWPKVPQYLLLGKGYTLSAQEMSYMGGGAFAGLGTGLDQSQDGLAISMDYHNGPLSTLMPFGIWGMISYLWVTLAAIFVLYRNWRYGDAEIKTVNAFLMALPLQTFIGYFFLFGAYSNDVGTFAKLAGFSVALNWGIKKAPALKTMEHPRFRQPPLAPPASEAQPV
jgi:hypothetical protein